VRRIAVLAALLLTLGFMVAGCGGGEEATPTPETIEGTTASGGDTGEATTGEATTGETETEAETETGETETSGGGGDAQGDAEAGAQVFASAGCGGCHTMSAANASGSVGPNLDDAKPDHELVVDRVTNGQGVMPSFKGQLSDQQIQDVSAYVVQSTSG
jgi:mono/diheme cytochrome c family protein